LQYSLCKPFEKVLHLTGPEGPTLMLTAQLDDSCKLDIVKKRGKFPIFTPTPTIRLAWTRRGSGRRESRNDDEALIVSAALFQFQVSLHSATKPPQGQGMISLKLHASACCHSCDHCTHVSETVAYVT
jgi:hypothetical protein